MKPRNSQKTKKKGWVKRFAPAVGMGDRMFDSLPYFFFVSGLALIMVWNVYRGQGTVKSIQQERTQVSELRSQSSTLLSEINNENKQSEVLRRMRQRKLGLDGSSPRKLYAENSN